VPQYTDFKGSFLMPEKHVETRIITTKTDMAIALVN